MDSVSQMENNEKGYKNTPAHFLMAENGVQRRLNYNLDYRKSVRLSYLDSKRNLKLYDVPGPKSMCQNKLEQRRIQLAKWKEEKKKKKILAQGQKKKPFVVGIVHHKLSYAPPPPVKPSTSGKIIRSCGLKTSTQVINTTYSKTKEASQSFAPSNASFNPPKLKNSTESPPLMPIVLDKKKNKDISFNSIEHDVNKKAGNKNKFPNIEQLQLEGLLEDDYSNRDYVEYFRCLLDSEVKHITEMCDMWEHNSHQLPLTESAMEILLGAVGQGRLLVSQMLAKFSSLLAICDQSKPGAAIVTPGDLRGFWDMALIQIENVNMRFKRLEDLRARNWVEEQPIGHKRKVTKAVKNNVITKPAATSRIRDYIAVARKAIKALPPQTEVVIRDTKETFDVGFLCVRAPVKSPQALSTSFKIPQDPSTPFKTPQALPTPFKTPQALPTPFTIPQAPSTSFKSPQAPSTPSNQASLLKAVLSSERKKASASKNSAFVTFRASLTGKSIGSSD